MPHRRLSNLHPASTPRRWNARLPRAAAGLLACLAALPACATRHAADEPSPAPATAEAAEQLRPRAVAVLRGSDGSAASWRAMLDACADADIVIIGEMHGHDLGLAVASAIWEDLLARAESDPARPRPVLSMEFFERDTQSVLDDYLTGVIDEETFRDLSRRSPGNYPPGHRAMVEAAKSAGVPVVAANAPRRYSTLARRRGFDALSELRPSQQALFALPGIPAEGPYRDRFFAVMAEMMTSHGDSSQGDGPDPAAVNAMVESFFRAQTVWDATMAESIALARRPGHAPIVHVVGQFHADFEGGTVLELRRHLPDARIVVVSMSRETAAQLPASDLGRADFIIPVGPAE